jgi:uncharacterized protein (DUF2267 family)
MDENKFLHEIEIRTGLGREQAFQVAITILQELHDRLTPKEAEDLAAQLPGNLKARWHAFDLRGRDVRRTHKEDFVRHIADVTEMNESQAGRALMAGFKALQLLLNSPTGREAEAWDVYSQLPKDLKEVWSAAATMPTPKARKTTDSTGR